MLVGDTAQLPPVGEEQSPALFAEALKGYGLEVIEVDLTQVVRQVQDSGILWNATRLRQLIAEDACQILDGFRWNQPDQGSFSGTGFTQYGSAASGGEVAGEVI